LSEIDERQLAQGGIPEENAAERTLAEISAFPRQGSSMKECYDSVRPRGAPSEITHRATPLIASKFGFVTGF
jgi:hypothetical protein